MRHPIRCPKFVAAAVVAFGCCPLATAGEAPAVPVLKGSYIYTQVENCVKHSGIFEQETGTAVFNPTRGIYKLDGYSVAGDPLTLTPFSAKTVYSNSGSTLTLGGYTFQVVYGELEDGVATSLSAITVVGSCGYQFWMSRK
ncbi:MAG: hypothetical protein ACJ8EL_16640 [Rhizomicrobium sp.]|jgi:hypothetical protein